MEVPSTVKVVTGDAGREYVAAGQFPSGTTLFKSQCLTIINDKYRRSHCHVCLTRLSDDIDNDDSSDDSDQKNDNGGDSSCLCTRSGWRLCGDCRSNSPWVTSGNHGPECAVMSLFTRSNDLSKGLDSTNRDTATLRLVMRHIAQCRAQESELCDNLDEMTEEQIFVIVDTAKQCKFALPSELRTSIDNIFVATAQVLSNSFEVIHEKGGPLGAALSAQGSLFNHSCSPNVERVYERGNLSFHLTKDVDADELLSLSYLSNDELKRPVKQRRALLSKRLYFTCGCLRCVEEASAVEEAARPRAKRRRRGGK